MTFNEHKAILLLQIEETTRFREDVVLQRIVEILKSIESVDQLKKERGLIDRICIDSVENLHIAEQILSFTDNYAKCI